MRSYPFYPARKCVDLDGLWDFAWLGDSEKLSEFQPADAVYDAKMAVPGVFDMGIDHYCQRGLGVYRRTVERFEAKQMRLHVAGMGLGARIFWDGKEVGFYPYAYTAMDFDFASEGDSHELVIAIDNRYDCVPVPQFYDYYDFYAYGGIYRSLTLYTLPERHMERVQFFTEDAATGKVRIKLLTSGYPDGAFEFEMAFDSGAYRKYSVILKNGVAEFSVNVPDFKLWTPEEPNLHKAYVRTKDDEILERFGIRTVTTQGQQILLNGKPVYLQGANLHETHPQFGPVQSMAAMVDDLRLFKAMGGNFLRLVHYPHDEAFLDLCDESGIMVWQESLGWGLSWGDHAELLFMPGRKECLMEQNRLMVASGINHPSVLIWAFLNECASNDDRAPELYQALSDGIHAQDPSRLVSWASDKKMSDKCFAAADVISINGYPGWFEDISDSSTFAWDLMPPYFKRHVEYFSKPEFADKPLLMSEIGACGMYGVHDRNFAQWTEEFQAEFMVHAAKNIFAQKRFCGFTLWQFTDSRSYGLGQIRGKPRGFNLAGLLDEYRRPKMAYDAIKKLFRGE